MGLRFTQEGLVALVQQLRVQLPNLPGALANLCTELAKVAVNISAIQAYEARQTGTVRLLVSHLDTAKRVCDVQGWKYAEEPAVAVHIAERPGSLGKITRKLAAGGVNVEYIYGSIERGSKRAMIILGVSDAEKASQLIK
jgi:hypothetical protein